MHVLLMRLEAPLMAFGREMVDATGPTRDDPDVSLITGLLANALGYERSEADKHQTLQDRIAMAVRIDRQGQMVFDFQTAQLGKDDRGWTTRGIPEGREGGVGTYKSPHIRFRHYRADAAVTVALSLTDPDDQPTVDDLAEALTAPARPLFIGRKPCVPAEPLLIGVAERESLLAALDSVPPIDGGDRHCHVLSRKDAEKVERLRIYGREDQQRTVRRDWVADVHAGRETRVVVTLERPS